MPAPPVTVIILAGQRSGVVNPLAARAGVSHKCLAPIRGKPLIAYVLDTLTALPAVKSIRISLEPEAHGEVGKLIAAYADRGIPIELHASSAHIVQSAFDAAGDDPGPFILTTADNVLLTPAAVAQVRRELTEVDGVLAMARKESVLAAHPDGQRGFYRLRGGEYANCNIYGLASREAMTRGAEMFRSGGQFMKHVGRMIGTFGLHNMVLLRLGYFDLASAMRRLGRRLGLQARATIFTDGSLAIDVDNERTFRVCEEILARREAAEAA
jgi:GTP:adenosylcobinamide-phosphate guanylyltransferase